MAVQDCPDWFQLGESSTAKILEYKRPAAYMPHSSFSSLVRTRLNIHCESLLPGIPGTPILGLRAPLLLTWLLRRGLAQPVADSIGPTVDATAVVAVPEVSYFQET
jgi:hypothetical protein